MAAKSSQHFALMHAQENHMAVYDLPGKNILMHNPMGLRIELNFDRNGLLELWISPGAGQDADYHLRNFSCRDDHTRLFDRIALPGLSADAFVKCDYDPFHSVVHFADRKLHALTLLDQPVVVLWLDRPQHVDLKSDKADAPVARTPKMFEVEHPDRGLKLTYAAALGVGDGAFRHQLQVDTGRSTYARAEAVAGQSLVIGGGLDAAAVRRAVRSAARKSPAALHEANEKAIAEALRPGSFELKGNGKLQKLLDLNRRVLLAMQDASGAIRAALNRIYYMIWTRDGAMIECFNGYAGNAGALDRWTDFLLANPTVIETETPRGRTYTQMVNGKISKWQEDGPFYAAWSAFAAWTQTGDESRRSPEVLALMNDTVEWLERYCFVKDAGLFSRFHACETPLPGSRGDGWDNAVGNPSGNTNVRVDGKRARQSFDIYVNLYMYAAYTMLAAMDEERADDYLARAEGLGRNMERFFGRGLPAYGDVLTEDGETVTAGPYGLDRCDYEWALTVPLFYPEPWRLPGIRKRLMRDAMRKPRGYFLAAYFSLLASLDTDWADEDEVMEAVRYAAEQCYPPGEWLAMPNTVIEMLDMQDGHPYHYVRPQAFSVGPWLATITGLGLRRLPFGLAVRATKTLRSISGYEYRGGTVDVAFNGAGAVSQVTLNGKPVENSLVLPESLLGTGRNEAQVTMSRRKPSAAPLLVGGTVRLNSVAAAADTVEWNVQAFGHNWLELRNLTPSRVRVLDADGGTMECTSRSAAGRLYVGFAGRGRFTAIADIQS